jgi:hypothetical protein
MEPQGPNNSTMPVYPIPPGKKDNSWKIVIAAVAVVVIIILAVLLTLVIGGTFNNNNQEDDDDDDNGPTIEPNLQIVTYSCEKTTYGDREFTVKVTNLGNAIGSASIKCTMEFDNSKFYGYEQITLAPGETDTFTIFVDIPATYFLDSGYYSVSMTTY